MKPEINTETAETVQTRSDQAVAPSTPCSAFVVIAYRYGMRDAHSYLVCVCDNLEDAKLAAEEEVGYRGGKYGCEVAECEIGPWNEDRECRQVHYVPSPYEGMIGEGCDQADRTTEGWKDRMAENLRLRMPRFHSPNANCDRTAGGGC